MAKSRTSGNTSRGNKAAGGGPSGAQPSSGASRGNAAQNTGAQKPSINASKMTTGEYMARYNAQNPNSAQKSASYDYTDPRAQANGYAKSQNMNYKLDTGQRLTSKEQKMLDGMEQMQKPLGKDTILHRGAHQDVLQALGVQNYANMSQSQLSNALVGKMWTSKSLTSTSYDQSKSPFLSGPLAGGREVVMRLHAAGSTKATMVNPSQAEVVLGRGTNFMVTGVTMTGRTANPRANYRPGGWPVVQLDIDVW